MSDYNSSLPIRTESAGDVISKIADATVPSQQLKVESDGSINTNISFPPGSEVGITDGTDSLAINNDGSLNAVVTATDLDIRDLTHVSDSIKVGDGTDLLAVNADGSLNITDNGGSITVDATDLDIRDLTSASDSVAVLQATHDNLNLNANLQVGDADVANGNPVPVSDAGGSLTVDATDLDIRDLNAAQDSVTSRIVDEAGVAFSDSNPLPVTLVDSEGTEVNDFNTASAVAAGATSNHDYTVSGGTTLKLTQIEASASAKMKIEVQIETGVATGVFTSKFVGFNSTSSPNISFVLKEAISVAAGVRVRVIRTNRDNQSQDLYSTICGHEI